MPKINPVPKKVAPVVTPQGSVWRGPSEDGITFSLLSRFLVCRERFRYLVVEGLKPADRFNHRLEFGQLWHTCEEALAAGVDWKYHLQVYAFNLARRYPMDQGEVHKWYEVCKLQFPIYLDYWRKHPDVTSRQNLLKEQVFDVPYKLPSGRTVRLRGKWDSVDLVGE